MKKKNKVIIIVIVSIITVITIGVFAITRNLSDMMLVNLQGVDTTSLNDGYYTGTFERGRFSNTLTVHIENNMIVGITLHKDMWAAREEISNDVFNKVIEAQSTDIDAISGATVTTNAYLVAIEDALKNDYKSSDIAPLDGAEDIDESESISLDGEWTMLRNTHSTEKYGFEILEDNSQPVSQTMFIYDDNKLSLVFYNHGTIDGIFNHTGYNEYTIDSFIVTNEMGERENRNGERWLRYDPESGLLRLTSFLTEDNMYIHTHYKRTDDK